MAQEELIKAAGIPYSILRSTQFFEFVGGIVKSGIEGELVRLSPALVQPIASDDVAAALAEVTLAAPLNGTVEVAGPDACPLHTFARKRSEERRVGKEWVNTFRSCGLPYP